MGRDEALELSSGPGSLHRVDGGRRVSLGLLIFPLNPCGATKGSIAQLAAAPATRSSGQRKRLPSPPRTHVVGLPMRFSGTSGAPRCRRQTLGWDAFGAPCVEAPRSWRRGSALFG